MKHVSIYRYEKCESISTNLDPLVDLITWLEYYSALDYVVSLLVTRHGLSASEAKQRAKLVGPHARLAREYIDQAMSGPRDVAFLPSYYAILNLLKICILFGKHHALLPANRWHGAAYDTSGNDSQSLVTDKITLHTGGALPLFYRTLTGQPVRPGPIRLGEIYGSILDVSHEFWMASGKPTSLAQLTFHVIERNARQHLSVNVALSQGGSMPTAKQLKALVGFAKDPSAANTFVSKPMTGASSEDFRPHLRTFLLYHHLDGLPGTRISGSPFVFPEEFPIALAFFHMSSVVRYKPEFLGRLKDSKYWAVLSTVRRHAMLKFLICFWSFTHQRSLAIHHA